LAGEAPARGWLLAAIGTWSLFLGLLVVSVFPVFSDPFSSLDPSWILGAISLLYGVGSVVLLLAFVLALPDVDDITWYDLAELDAEAALGGAALDPFADGDEAAGVQLFELEDRRLDA
jgi:hypothetical protein